MKQNKSVNNINYKFSNINLNNNQIYSSSNKLYNYRTNNNSLGNKYYMNNISYVNDNKTEKYNNFEGDIFSYKELSRSFKSSIDGDKSEFILSKEMDSDDENEKEEQKNNEEMGKTLKKEDFHKHKKEIKKKFYLIISVFYFSLYILCLKITLQLSMPKIPAIGVSSFIICFNILFISLLFMKLDQINFKDYLNFDKIDSYFFKIIFNYIRILLTIKSIQNLKLISFVLILNMNSIIISYISIRENNRSYKPQDFFCYFIFILIVVYEFLVNNKISMICLISLMILNTFISFTKLTLVKNIHSYIIDFGTSLIGIAISPIIMSINRDIFEISISQYLLFIIICIAYFLNHYFEKKFSYYNLGQGYKIFSNALIISLYILYSNFLLRESNYLNSYLFLISSFCINLYGKMRIENFGV